MTKADTFDKATRLAMKGDLKLYDEIVHSDYESMNQRVPEFVCIHRYSRVANTEIFNSVMTAIIYKNGKVVNTQPVRKELDYIPSEGKDWNWENYE